MSFDKILVLISHESRRGRLTARQFKVELGRLEMGSYYRRPNNINLFREYLRDRQFTFGEGAKSAIKFSIHGVRKQDDQDGPKLVAKLSRTISGEDVRTHIGTVKMNLRTGEIGYNAKNIKGDPVDYVEMMQGVVEEYHTKRQIQYDEIDVVLDKMLRRIGFSDGPTWFIQDDEELLDKFHRLLAVLYEWGYNYRTLEVPFKDLKKSSRIPAEVEKKARDFVLAEVRRITGRGKRVFSNRYRGINFILEALRDEGVINIQLGNGEITLVAKEED